MVCYSSLLSVYINGMEDLWVVGDEFVANTANQYFKEVCNALIRVKKTTGTYCRDNYKIKLFHATYYTSNIKDMMGCLISIFVDVLNTEAKLPRAILVVLDDNMINYAKISGFGISMLYSHLLHYLFSEFNKLILARKDYLPAKALKAHYPELLWINPPLHASFRNNSQRVKFAKILDTTAAIYPDMWSLKLKRI